MLSEHEILELLEQLKFGALSDASSESDPVGHWPVLIGDGACLNLQAAARTEFVRQPDQVTVVSGLQNTATLGLVSSSYHQLHHVSTGVQNCSLVIAYDDDCLKLLPRLHVSERSRGWLAERTQESALSTYAYDFSLAVASSLDPSAKTGCDNHPAIFLPLDLSEDTRFSCGWRIALEFGYSSAEFFIGLLNPIVTDGGNKEIANRESAEICVKPESITRSRSTNEISVSLGAPQWLGLRRTRRVGHFNVTRQGGDIHLLKQESEGELSAGPGAELMVQRSFQLSVDDLYLLLVEAIGCDLEITIQFIAEAVFGELDDFNAYLLPEHSRLRCLSINDLPVKNAYIVVEEGCFRLHSDE